LTYLAQVKQNPFAKSANKWNQIEEFMMLAPTIPHTLRIVFREKHTGLRKVVVITGIVHDAGNKERVKNTVGLLRAVVPSHRLISFIFLPSLAEERN
jgi:hypothetical protein